MPGNPKCLLNRLPESCIMQTRQGRWFCNYYCPQRTAVQGRLLQIDFIDTSLCMTNRDTK